MYMYRQFQQCALTLLAALTPALGYSQLTPPSPAPAPPVSPAPTSIGGAAPRPATPPGWFAIPGIKEHLGITDQQFGLLQQAHASMSLQMQQAPLNGGTDAQRLYALAVDKILFEPSVRMRFDQLHWQYLGPMAFADPDVQNRLGLSDTQRVQFANLGRDWTQDLATLRELYRTEPGIASQQFLKSRLVQQDKILALLEPTQRLALQPLLGDRYEFDASVYLAGPAGRLPDRDNGGGSESIRAMQNGTAKLNSSGTNPPANTARPANGPDPKNVMGSNKGLPPNANRPSSSQGSPVVGEGGEGLENRNTGTSNPGAVGPLVP